MTDNRTTSNEDDTDDPWDEYNRLSSDDLASLVVDALHVAGIVKCEDVRRAVTIAVEEIDERKILGDYWYSLPPKLVGSCRPPLAEMSATLKQIAARADVQAVLVSIDDDSLYYLERGEPYGGPATEHVILITTAARKEVERWVEDFGADSVDDGWPAAKHPAAPVPAPGHRVYTVVWD